MDDMVKKHNRELCERYPFLITRNRWTGEPIDDYDYEFTELDDMPDGWRKAFGEQMCEDIREVLVEDDDLDGWHIVQMKEKFGELRLYYNRRKDGSRIDDVIDKYERISAHTCIGCGKPATRRTTRWICTWCDDCCPSPEWVPIKEDDLIG